MRTITDHVVDPVNERLWIEVLDAPGPDGAHHAYAINGFDVASNPSAALRDMPVSLLIVFQNGPIAECGVNGVTHEALLAILIDRLRSYQAGPYACAENELALAKLQEALAALHARTLARIRRGVEGTRRP